MHQYLCVLMVFTATTTTFAGQIFFSSAESNDLFRALQHSGASVARRDSPVDAAQAAENGAPLLVLADQYPDVRVDLDEKFFELADRKGLRLYLEFPGKVPGVELGDTCGVTWERVVVAREALGLEKLRILGGHDLRVIETRTDSLLLTLARVAGYDTAVYGLPTKHSPVLFEMRAGRWLVATTKLSGFVTGRFAPQREWKTAWEGILRRLGQPVALEVQATVYPSYGKDDPLAADVERVALARAATWYRRSRLLVPPSRVQQITTLGRSGIELMQMPAANDAVGDGALGILEGYASRIYPDGTQPQRAILRADCQAETAMVLAMGAKHGSESGSARIATNLLNYTYFTSGMCGPKRGDPRHPSFGLIAWGAISPAWEVANYGDDNARTILATLAAAAALESGRWDEPVLRALLANLRTTGKLGFRGDRIDQPQLEKTGWKHYHDAETINTAPHFESGLWACYLWAYARTGEKEFLDKARCAMRMTMAVYPSGWRWKDNLERSRILLPLAWLLRVEDTPEHRRWLKQVASDLLKHQAPCGAIRDHIEGNALGHYQVARSNEAYGTSETPLIQSNEDAACDQLYTTGFALLGLHEAVAATDDAELREAEDKLAKFLCRIQIRSEKHPWLDGAWFRAFDFAKWDYWASSGDMGWGAWCVEAGWGQAWTAATLALRSQKTSLWDLTATSRIASCLAKVQQEMSRNNGSPLVR